MTATATMLQVELWQVIVFLVGVLTSVLAGGFVLIRLLMQQFDKRLAERFDSQEKARAEAAEHWNQRFAKLENDDRTHREELQAFRLKVSEEYWRREDAIRQEVVLHAKIDALAAKIDNLALRAARPKET
jgi:demethoxyubiquinone hydroxylase (CLK1/Coq7/Cat5 family)